MGVRVRHIRMAVDASSRTQDRLTVRESHQWASGQGAAELGADRVDVDMLHCTWSKAGGGSGGLAARQTEVEREAPGNSPNSAYFHPVARRVRCG